MIASLTCNGGSVIERAASADPASECSPSPARASPGTGPALASKGTGPAPAGRIKPSILLVDDDKFTRDIQARLLTHMRYPDVRTAGAAEDALKLVLRDPDAVDVVICDLNMPGMDGIAFIRALDASPFCGKVILLSGEGGRILHSVQRLLGGGRLVILGALEKPTGAEALGRLLDLWEPPGPAQASCARRSFDSADIAEALRQQQWVLHYQPKVNLGTGVVEGLEALVRWAHPEHGLIYPDQFICKAEESGAIDPLTDWVLDEALKRLSVFRSQGLLLQMAVNISMTNLQVPGFAQHIAALLQASGTAPRDVMLEITESRLLASDTLVLEALVRLRMQRVGLSIDDFGTGHSTLAQLRDVPFSELKVDKGFVSGARNNQIIRPMLEASVGIAKRLGMTSVAEGVETEDDWQLLREIGCDVAQGYFIARPMPAEQVSDWIADWRRRIPMLLLGDRKKEPPGA